MESNTYQQVMKSNTNYSDYPSKKEDGFPSPFQYKTYSAFGTIISLASFNA